MGRIRFRIPESLHQTVRALADKESVSINQLITMALAEKVPALMTEEYLSKRTKRGSLRRFRRALAKVPDVSPPGYDRI